MAAVRDACDHVVSFATSSPSQAMVRHGDRASPLRCEAVPRHCWPVAFCQSHDFPPTTTQPNAGSGKEIPEGGRERARGEVAKSGALSQWDFGFSLCAGPKFQV